MVPNGGMLIIHWTLRGQSAASVMGLHLSASATVNQTTATECGAQVRAAFLAANCPPYMHTSSKLIGVGIRDLRMGNLPEWPAVMTEAAGTDNTEPLPLSTSCVVTLRTALAGRSFRGRSYVPLDGGAGWDGAAQAYTTLASQAAGSFIGNIRSNLNGSATLGGNFQLAVLSRERHTVNPVVAYVVRSAINGTQKGRLPHRG